MVLPTWFWTWARWYLGRSEFKGHARDPRVRPPSAPKMIPTWAWQELRRRFVKPTPPPPPDGPLVLLARNVMFTAWAPEKALQAPADWRVAVSADPAYDMAARTAAPKLKQQGRLVGVWGNQAQTGADRIRALANAIGADFTIMQGETSAEYASAIAGGAKIIVGNVHSWTPAQRDDASARAKRGELAVMMEVYANVPGQAWPDTADSLGVPISCEVLGIGGWSGAPDVQLDAYRAHTPAGVWATMSVYTAEYLSPTSWSSLP